MKFHQFISVILHPIVIPTIGILIYFIKIPNSLNSNQKLGLICLIFVTTYLIPLLILILFKRLKLIQSFQLHSISERKIPISIMIVLFYLLGNTLNHISYLSDLGILFYATSMGLVIIYVLFIFKIKTSIHLLSLGITVGFFLILNSRYNESFIFLICTGLVLSGVLASARLHLKAHSQKEVYLGFFLGFIAPLLVNYFL